MEGWMRYRRHARVPIGPLERISPLRRLQRPHNSLPPIYAWTQDLFSPRNQGAASHIPFKVLID